MTKLDIPTYYFCSNCNKKLAVFTGVYKLLDPPIPVLYCHFCKQTINYKDVCVDSVKFKINRFLKKWFRI